MGFCFKQKKADEMRISDWRSDLCSSDLRRRSGRRSGTFSTWSSPLGVSGAGSRQAPRRIIGSERLRRRGAAGTAVRSLLYAHWAAGGTEPPSSGNISRSEEHTSELQSIMRISYAVFCLKKKNKTNAQ